jgi:hypothetical protein
MPIEFATAILRSVCYRSVKIQLLLPFGCYLTKSYDMLPPLAGGCTVNRSIKPFTSPFFVATLGLLASGLLAIAANVTFGPSQQYPVQQGPAGVAVADFDGDHKVDLVVPNVMAGSISVFSGKGDGTFSQAKNYDLIDSQGTPEGILPVVAADFNRDRKMDIAVVNSNRQTLDVLLGNGDGTFGRGPTLHLPDVPFSLVAGDFNNDGKIDLAVTSVQSFNNSKPGLVSIFLGNGDGTFVEPPQTTSVGCNPYSIAAADFNEDRNLDLVVTTTDKNNPKRVQVLLGKGNGTFSAPLNLTAGESPLAVAIGRFDRSKHPGFAVSTPYSGVTVFTGDGRGGFTSWTSPPTVEFVHSLAVADFNHDGIDDVVIDRPPGSAEIMLSDGNGRLLAGTTYALGPSSASGLPNWALVAADLNGDKYPDLIGTNIPTDPTKHFIAVAINQH